MKAFFMKIWNKIKSWFTKTFIPWFKLASNWMQIVNMIVLFVVFSKTDLTPGLQAFVALWLFVLLVYYIFWKLLGVEHWFK